MEDPFLYSSVLTRDNKIVDICQYCGVISSPQDLCKHFNNTALACSSINDSSSTGERILLVQKNNSTVFMEKIQLLDSTIKIDNKSSSSKYECNQCGTRVNSKSLLNHMKSSLHIKCILGNQKYVSNIIMEKGYFDGTVYGCTICELFVQGVLHLQKHFFGLLHGENLEESASKMEETDFIKICNLVIPRGKNSIELPFLHGKISEKKKLSGLICLICNVSIVDLNSLGEHFLLDTHRTKIMKTITTALTENLIFQTIEEEPLENESKALIIPFDVKEEIKSDLLIVKSTTTIISPSRFIRNDISYINQKYNLEDLKFENMVFQCDQEKIDQIISSIQRSCFKFENSSMRYCLYCSVAFKNDYYSFFRHFNGSGHTRRIEEFDESVFIKPFIKRISNKLIHCHVCHVVMENDNKVLIHHLDLIAHHKKAEELDKDLKEFSCTVLREIQNVWYRIHKFACVLCNIQFSLKIDFIRHCQTRHFNRLATLFKKEYLFDFCITCGYIWLEEKSDKSIHFRNQMHRYLEDNKLFVVGSLAENAQNYLLRMDKNIEEINKKKCDNRKDEEKLLKKLKKYIFSEVDVNIHPIGSRVTGLSSSSSNLDVQVDGEKLDRQAVINIVEKYSQLHESWKCNGTIEDKKYTIIQLQYNRIGLKCNLYFFNELCVENTKLTRLYIKLYESCKVLILFLKKWLFLSVLPGPTDITSYAFSWMIIFYLQHKHDLPSVVDLLRKGIVKGTSKIVLNWETVIDDNSIDCIPIKSVRELALGFFQFFGEFDYRNNVICPLMGKIITKKSFANPKNLPKEMELYNRQLNSYEPKYFNIHAVMCLQDPIDLSHNLTQTVETITLNHFREYCKQSFNIVQDEHDLLLKIKELNSIKNSQFVVLESGSI